MRLWSWIASAWLIALLLPAGSSAAEESERAEANGKSAAHAYFSDVVLVDQHGKPLRLYTDLLKGKVVVVSSFYASCTGSCPVLMGTLAKIQEALSDRLGSDLHLLSITVDPATDTPPKLKEYAERIRAKPGWYFLTGAKDNVDTALRKLGQAVKAKESHLNILIVGNERTGLWKRAFSLARPEELIALVEGTLQNK
ncbi:MAG TPA: SCO family protein [Methylomirabilota bacterium]|nr:SCO family protein [Methylomirabilota bacterium]